MAYDHSTGLFRFIGVPDIDGDLHAGSGQDRVGMEHGRAHIGKGTQFPVAHIGDGFRLAHNSGIRRVQTGYIRPVLIEIRVDGACRKAPGDIGAAPFKSMDSAGHIRPVEAGDHSMAEGQKGSLHGPGRHGAVELSVLVKTDAPGRIHKSIAQIGSHDPGGQVFAPAGCIVPLRIRL